jgi:hypothetical protein
MKNQYFGDINDYKKYGLIRIITCEGKIQTGVCWMMTPDDGRTDDKFTDYLNYPEKWKRYDPPLFDFVKLSLDKNKARCLSQAEEEGVLPNSIYYSKQLMDDSGRRQQYFLEMGKLFEGVDLIFFDPDNGLEVKSKKVGNKDSAKFLYWDELAVSYRNGHSVLVYQHFARVKRDEFVNNLVSEIYSRIEAHDVISFKTSNVVFFLISQPKHSEGFRNAGKMVADIWGNQIIPEWHDADG